MSNGHNGDITIDVSSTPYETGFKFNTIPFGGMTIDAGNAVRLSSACVIILATNHTDSNGVPTLPDPSAELRGGLFFLRKAVGSGNADSLHVCRKKADDTGYEWKVVNVS